MEERVQLIIPTSFSFHWEEEMIDKMDSCPIEEDTHRIEVEFH